MSDKKKLPQKQELFVQYYLGEAKGNASKAALLAGYTYPGQEGHRLLKKAEIRRRVSEHVAAIAMTKEEVLELLDDHANGSLADFTSIDDDGRPKIDLAKAKRLGKLHLVKEITVKPDGEVRLKLYDAQTAATLLGKHHRLFVDRTEISGPDGQAPHLTITINGTPTPSEAGSGAPDASD